MERDISEGSEDLEKLMGTDQIDTGDSFIDPNPSLLHKQIPFFSHFPLDITKFKILNIISDETAKSISFFG